ncbi:MAG: Gfo/Idh/MocA family oxidoreductase, partial [Armatimonadota bacterium]|nr:Gfo/Idh/MocA family oxidoreductase [Armatimonadota bacterium]
TMHAGPVVKRPEFELVAVCDIDPARRALAAERHGCAVYEEYHEMLRRERLDLVCVITRSDQHCQMTCDCLAAGVNVLVTKPWAVNAAEGERMVAAAEASGKLLLPWLPTRWGAPLRRLRQLVSEKAVGEVFIIRRAVCSFATRSDWQTERRYGGGYLLNWGAHIVDPAVLLGGSPVRSVYGRMKQTINPGDAEDVFLAILTLENGVLVQAEYTIAIESLPDWFVQGTRGTIVVRGRELTLHRNTPAHPSDPTRYGTMQTTDNEVITETLGPHLYGDEYEIYGEIAQALRGERSYPVTPGDALQLSRVFDAIRTSSEENRVVFL